MLARLRPAAALLLLLAPACGGGGSPPDASRDAGADAVPDAGDGGLTGCAVPHLRWERERIGATPGVRRRVGLSLSRDYPCGDAGLTLTASEGSVATFPAEATIAAAESRIEIPIDAESIGTTTITATWEELGETRTAELPVIVADESVPGCTGSASGRVAPGDVLEVETSGALVAVAEGAAREDRYHVDPFDAEVACADDQVPDGYHALGPAIRFGPEHLRFDREIDLAVPIKLALLPSGAHRGHVKLAYTGPGVATPRVVPVASPWLEGSPAEGTLHFQAPRLGTYQAVLSDDVPVRRMREMTYRAITGVSMGAGGSGLIALRNPELFDFAAPLGGPVDWIYMLDYIRTYHLGGFCTEDERVADPEGCAEGASVTRTPPRSHLHEHRQDFEHWHYVDEYQGQGGTFDRKEYLQIFRDLTMMYGNANTNRTADPSEPNITPPGVPDSRRSLSDGERCANPVVIPPCDGTFPDCAEGTGFADQEYNPEGQYPVSTFCDGAELHVDGDRDIGVWDPDGSQYYPVEVTLFVDVDGNGVRDPGEPLIRNGVEPYDDCGLDATCNPDEAGYDAVTNPDPAGDDYDFQFNPNGTEGNRLRDTPDDDPCNAEGEAFLDAGLDGIIGTQQLDEGGYDDGEGNGCWDMARGARRMLDRNPRSMVLEADPEELRDLDIFTDGGIRDLFNFATIHDQFAGAFAARGLGLNIFNSHRALTFEQLDPDPDATFQFTRVDWNTIGKYVMVRYGDPDATEGAKVQGDGGHVGTPTQIVNRLLSVIAWIGKKWPDGDRERLQDRICTPTTPLCDDANQFTFDFTSPTTGRTGPVSMILPPGYFMEDHADETYPVVYFGHGYGQEPDDLIAVGIILWNQMIAATIPKAERLQKMIFVIPDGRCRGEECVKGTFYTDAPESTPGGAQMETFMLDLMDHVDANYRTRAPEMIEVVE